MKKIGTWLAALVAGALIAGAGAARAEVFSLKIASGHNTSWHFIQITKDFFIPEVVKRVKERTKHEVNFIEGFASAMVKPTEVLEGLQSGIIDVGIFCICHEGQKLALHNFPMYLPFGPRDPVISLKATREVYKQVPELPQMYEQRYGQRVLAMVPFESYNLLAKFAITKAEDLKGRKVGAAGPNLFWVEPAGALPLTVTGPEVYTAFQNGLMEVNIVFISIMDTLKLYDVAPYISDVGFGSMTITTLNMSTRSFNRLPKEVQDIILEVANEMEQRAGPFTQEVVDRYAEIVKKGGAKINVLTDEQRRAWAESIAQYPNQIAAKIEGEAGVPLRKAMKAYIAATKAAGYVWPVEYKLD